MSGTLTDGTDLTGKNLYVRNGTGASFAFNPGGSAVPEPDGVAFLFGLAGFGVSLLRARRIRLDISERG